jgi:N-acetylneuraminate lyase
MWRQMDTFKLGGLVAAPHTPFNTSGDLNLDVIDAQASALADAGVKGAFICGTTGEGLSLSCAERMRVAERWVTVCRGGPLKVIVHVGHNCRADSVALAEHARRAGASAVAALPPFYFKPTSVVHLVEFLKPVADAAGPLPIYYYHIPSMTGVGLSMAELLDAAGGRFSNLRGIKFTHSDLLDFQRCIRSAGGAYEMAWGFDEMLLGALAVGGRAAVGSTYNFASPLYLRMIEAYDRRDMAEAQACAARTAEMVAILLKFGVLRATKATMSMIGIDCGPPRAPLTPLSERELASMRDGYERIGFFEWALRAR